jgi:hypothetical protein
VGSLDYELYEDGIATVELSPTAVRISAATWSPDLGLATDVVDAERLRPGDISGH